MPYWTRTAVSVCLAIAALSAQTPRTHIVRVNTDGTFAPALLSIRSGDTVRWEGLTRTDSIIPVSGANPYPALCAGRQPVQTPADPLDFTGPPVFAPSGVFTLSPLERGFTDVAGSACPPGSRLRLRGDNGRILCEGGGEYQATLTSTWQSPHITGVFIRLLWKDLNPAPGLFDFTVLEREVEQAVGAGKVYSLGVKAGDDGTPAWIFSNGVPRLSFQDNGDDPNASTCGNRMDLGNPTRAAYKQHYFNMLTAVARFLKQRTDWYRALAYVKISGANLVSHENRLPNSCSTVRGTQCPCNPKIFAEDGYRPSALYAFYDEQNALLRSLFPGKPVSYALIQAGFPRVNETGGYEDHDGRSSNGAPLPDGTETTETIMNRGQAALGLDYVVQHNGVGPKPAARCNFEGQHPKPVVNLPQYWAVSSGCPNRWAVREGAEGQITGFQTNNRSGVGNPAELDSAFQNTLDNSDGVFVEIYEDVFWEAANQNGGVLSAAGRTVRDWDEQFHQRRTNPSFPNFTRAGNPFPSTFSFTFNAGGSGPRTLYYVHGSKCGQGRQEFGQIVIDAAAPAIRSTTGVVTASAFGGAPAAAPGSWIEIYGSNFSATTRAWTDADFSGINAPTSLDGTTVSIGGQPAYVSYISPGQVNVQVPSNVPIGMQPVTVTAPAGTSPAFNLTVNSVQPALLAPPSFLIGGRQYVVALFPDNVTYVLPENAIPGVPSRPARPGDVITLYGVGFGPTAPSVPAGQVTAARSLLSSEFRLQVDGATATIDYSGLAPGAVGLYQFNVRVPAINSGFTTLPLSFTLGATPGNQTLYLAVQNQP